MTLPALFAQYTTTYTTTSSSNSDMNPGVVLLYLAVILVYVIAMWRIFDKAKKPGWAAIVPIYDEYMRLKVIGRPAWWLLLYLIPLVNIVIWFIVSVDMAKSFGKSVAFGIIGLGFFPLIGYLILGYGSAQYKGPSVSA